MSHSINAYWLTCTFFALGLFPGLLAVRWLRLPSYFWMPLTLAASSLVAYGMFWAYFFAPIEARAMTPVVVGGSALGFGAYLHRSAELRAYLRARDAWFPGVLMLCLLTAYLAFLAWPGLTSTMRFTMPLPPEDNLVPRYLADRLFFGYYRGVTPPSITTFLFETRSSDRPPLQAAVVLSVRALGSGQGSSALDPWTYQVLTTVCQMVWVPALYALSRALDLTRRQIAFVLIGAACSGFFLLHSLYTWPKLFAAWLFLTALAIVVHVIRRQPPATVPLAIATGVLLALSLLAHGGPFFSIIALPVLVAQRGAWRRFALRHVLAASVAGALVLAPWSAYQRYYDPPGNRLLKLHLAGVSVIDARTTTEALRDAYAGIGLSEYVWGRWENLKEQWLVFGKSNRSHPVDWTQWQQFFHHVPALDVLALGLLGGALSRREAGRPAPTGEFGVPQLAWYTLAALAIWMVLLFPPGSAMIHHGSYATTTLLFVCAAAFAARLSPWLAFSILWLHVAVFVAFWLPMRLPADVAPRAVWSVPAAALMVAAFAGFIVLALNAAPDAYAAPAEP